MSAITEVPKSEKRCSRCEETKALGEFARDRTRKLGVQHYCRHCFREIGRESTKRGNARKLAHRNAVRRAAFGKACILTREVERLHSHHVLPSSKRGELVYLGINNIVDEVGVCIQLSAPAHSRLHRRTDRLLSRTAQQANPVTYDTAALAALLSIIDELESPSKRQSAMRAVHNAVHNAFRRDQGASQHYAGLWRGVCLKRRQIDAEVEALHREAEDILLN